MNYENYENKIFADTPELVEGCNFESCVFYETENTTFTKCNITNCTFNKISNFEYCNLGNCELIEGSTYYKSNVYEDEPEPEPEVEVND